MPKKPPETLGIIYRMPLEDLHPHPLNPYGVRDDPASWWEASKQTGYSFRPLLAPERKVDTN